MIKLPSKLTANFTAAEATTTSTVIDNYFDTFEQLMNTYETARRMREARAILNNQPVIVSSWCCNAQVWHTRT